MTAEQKDPELRLEMSIRPRWRNVDLVRSAVLACVAAVAKGTGTDTIGVVASELVENAIKYGAWDDDPSARLELRIVTDGQLIDVAVSNAVGADQGHFATLEKTLAWIRSFPAPEDAYIARMRAILEEEETSGSHMGLLRVVHEGPCTLSAEKSPDGKRVLVRATMRLGDA